MSDTPSTPSADNTNGRDAKGRFTAGNEGGPGNPFARRCAELRAALLDCVTDKDVIAIVQILLDKAKKGDVAAAKLLLAYALGKPAAAVSPDRVNLDEWQILRASSPMAQELATVFKAPSPDLPLDIARGTQPLISKALRYQMGKMMHQPAAEADAQKSPKKPHGKKHGAQPSTNGGKPQAPWLDPASWFVDLDIAGPSADGK